MAGVSKKPSELLSVVSDGGASALRKLLFVSSVRSRVLKMIVPAIVLSSPESMTGFDVSWLVTGVISSIWYVK